MGDTTVRAKLAPSPSTPPLSMMLGSLLAELRATIESDGS